MFTVEIARGIAYPKGPGTRVPQTILIIMVWDLVVWIVIWKHWICLFTVENTKKIAYPKSPGTSNPSNHMNYFILGVRGQDYHLGKLNFFVHHWEYKWNYISKGPGTPGPLNHIKHYVLGFGGLDYHLGELTLFVYH